MNIISYTYARQNLASVLQKVHDDYDPAVIMHKGREPSVIIPLSQWEQWNETDFLAASPANREALNEGIAQLERGEGTTYTMEEFLAKVEQDAR